MLSWKSLNPGLLITNLQRNFSMAQKLMVVSGS